MVHLQSGLNHTCFVRSNNNKIFCWGHDDQNQISIPEEYSSNIHKQESNQTSRVINMALGQWHTCAAFSSNEGLEFSGDEKSKNKNDENSVKDQVKYVCWGKNDFGQTDIGDLNKKYDLKVIAAGCNFTCAANTSKITCIGDNQFLSLDDNYSTNDSNHFFEIDDPDEAGSHIPYPADNTINNPSFYIDSTPKFGEQIASISAGGLHACALGRKSLVKCWGSNSHGQAEVGGLLKALEGGFRAVTLGLQHSCGLSHDLVLICWGSDQYKQWDIVRQWQNKNSVVTEVTSIGHMTCAKGYSYEVICNNYKKQQRMMDDVLDASSQLSEGEVDGEDRGSRVSNLAFESSYVKFSIGKLEYPRLISISKDHICFIVNESTKIYELKCLLIQHQDNDEYIIDKLREKMHIINEHSAQTNNEYLTENTSSELTKTSIQSISLGESNTCFMQNQSPGLFQGSAVKCIGKNRKKLNNIPQQIQAHLNTISTSYNHTCALSTKSTLMITKRTNSSLLDEHAQCWGDNSKGQTDIPKLNEKEDSVEGNDEETRDRKGVDSELKVFLKSGKGEEKETEKKIDQDEESQEPQSKSDLNSDSEPHATSSTDSDQEIQKNPNSLNLKYPVFYSGQVRTGLEFSCALTYDKNQPPIFIFGIKCWGSDSHRQLTPPRLDTIKMLEVGSGHGCAIHSSLNHMACWGANTVGQATPPGAGKQHTEVQFVKVRLGFQHSCGITYNSDIQCWGWAGSRNNNLLLPRQLKGLGLAAGQAHTCTLSLKREVKCQGSNEFGQLEAPEGISLSVMHIEAGQQHTCADLIDGRVVCWGRGDKGQLEVPDCPEGYFTGQVEEFKEVKEDKEVEVEGEGEGMGDDKVGDGNQ